MGDEILVHISAPTTNFHDDVYRSLAADYHNFQPEKSYGEVRSHESANAVAPKRSEMQVPVTPMDLSRRLVTTNAGSSILSTSKSSYGSFPSDITTGCQSKVLRVSVQDSIDYDLPPTSSRLARLERIHSRWKEQTTPTGRLSGAQQRLVQGSSQIGDDDTTFIEDTQLGVRALQSQLQDEYESTEVDTDEDEMEVERHTEESGVLDGIQERDAQGQETLLPLAVSSSTGGDERYTLHPEITFSTPIQSQQVQEKTFVSVSNAVGTPEILNVNDLPMDAFPPAPKISIERPGTLPSQITKQLAAIKTQNPARFKPCKQRGNPKHDDRGYWLVDCSGWPDKLQVEFWTALSSHVENGSLGWGTTLHRVNGSPRELGQVRLYCWAEVVEHVWLLLWLCSRGQVVGSRSKWIDGDGVAAFKME